MKIFSDQSSSLMANKETIALSIRTEEAKLFTFSSVVKSLVKDCQGEEYHAIYKAHILHTIKTLKGLYI